ncbi:Ralgps2 [Columba guinea]|nr:Ralgps2 [Columba guinea]
MLVGKKAGRRFKRLIDKAVGSLELRLIRTAGFVPHFNEGSFCLVNFPHVAAGIYLSDLTYIDSAYPSTGSILESEQRTNLMNNILRIISDLQQSCEYDIPLLPHVQKYLNSVQYIEELQKFVEDDNYKLSLKIEPGTSTPHSAASREDLVGSEVGASPQSGRKSVAAEGALLPATPPSPRNLIPHGHRKCHSLGYNFIHKMNTAEFKSATFPNAGPRHLLDDSVMEPHVPSRGQAESSTLSSGISIGSSDGSELSEETSWPAFERHRLYHSLGPGTRVSRNGYRGHMKASSSLESEDLAVHLYPGAVTIQGVLRRKTLLKEGKKPTVASWTKYWVALCGTQLFYYAAKSLKATERKHFKSTPSKNVSVVGWMVMMADDPEHPDLFLLTDSEKGNSYKFQAGNRMNAMLWFKHLSAACQSNRQQSGLLNRPTVSTAESCRDFAESMRSFKYGDLAASLNGLVDIECQVGVETQVEFLVPILVLLYCAKPDSALMACSKGAPYCRLLFATALIFNGGHTDAEDGCDQCLAHKP